MVEYYSIQSSQDVIEHFGIKGMRWGMVLGVDIPD